MDFQTHVLRCDVAVDLQVVVKVILDVDRPLPSLQNKNMYNR